MHIQAWSTAFRRNRLGLKPFKILTSYICFGGYDLRTRSQANFSGPEGRKRIAGGIAPGLVIKKSFKPQRGESQLDLRG